MRAIGYLEPTATATSSSLQQLEVPLPTPGPRDILVRIKAISVNPVDFKIRRSRAGKKDAPVILGWDAAGIVDKVGSEVRYFAPGDRVYYAGDLTRQGTNAEFQCVDERIVGHMPNTLSFADAASLPLTTLTAFEALFEKLQVPTDRKSNVLIIGGAGGVGSIAVQALKALTSSRVFATAGRPESKKWLEILGADVVVDRTSSIATQLENAGAKSFDYVFSTTHSDEYAEQIAETIAPFGSLCLIDDPRNFNFDLFKRKAVTVSWELMFTKSLYQYKMDTQREILQRVATLVDEGKIRATVQKKLLGLSAANLITAHQLLETGASVGKIVIEY